ILAAAKEDPWTYAMTLAFLVRSGGPEAGPFVVEGIRHPNGEVKLAASNLLLQLSPQSYKPAIGLLAEGLKDPSYFVAARCARCLFSGGRGAKSAPPAPLQPLEEPTRDFWEPRSYAACALGWRGIRGSATLPALIEAVQQPSYKEIRIEGARH